MFFSGGCLLNTNCPMFLSGGCVFDVLIIQCSFLVVAHVFEVLIVLFFSGGYIFKVLIVQCLC